jgi:anti-sigma factor RsiW
MTAQRHKHAMNMAIDHMLSSQEQEALDAHLETVPQDAALWERMKRLDRNLRSAATVPAPAGFADRVMLAIANGRGPKYDPRFGLGTALGLLVVALTAIPFFSIVTLGLITLITNQAAVGALLAELNNVFSRLTVTSAALTQFAAQTIQSNPILVALALLSVPLAAVWVYMLRLITAEPRTVTYRIPVRVSA